MRLELTGPYAIYEVLAPDSCTHAEAHAQAALAIGYDPAAVFDRARRRVAGRLLIVEDGGVWTSRVTDAPIIDHSGRPARVIDLRPRDYARPVYEATWSDPYISRWGWGIASWVVAAAVVGAVALGKC